MSAHRGSPRKSLLFLSVFILVNATGVLGQVRSRVVEAVDRAKRVTLTGNVHPLARAEFDRGVVADTQPMTRMLLLLKRSGDQETALRNLMEEQQDKSSANYHKWLTPEDFGAQFGPADADIQSVTQWLESQGFKVEKVYSGKTVIEFSGTVGQVRSAFGTGIHQYQVKGKTFTANASDPQLPAALGPVVAGIVSLNNFPRKSHIRKAGLARKSAGKPGLQPQFTFPLGSLGTFYGLGPGDFATIYNSKNLISSGTDGTGQSIAIVGETNFNMQDMTDFRKIFGLPATVQGGQPPVQVILNGEDPGITSVGEETEADLDVQWSGAAAPGAKVDYVLSASTAASQGVDLSALYIIEHNLAGVMSESYGACEADLGNAGNAFFNALWQQAAAQGITVILSSGDSGSAGCDDPNSEQLATLGLAVSGLASTPYNVSLGGTDFDQVNKWSSYWNTTNDATTGTSALGYIPEIPWNQSCAQYGRVYCGNVPLNIVAGGGGPSGCATQTSANVCTKGYAKPSWQIGVAGMPNDNLRDQPDLSLFASAGFDNSGYVVCQQDENPTGAKACDLTVTSDYWDFQIVGGTSASAPAFAGIMALVNQYQAALGGASRQGNPNYVLYALAKRPGASCTSSATEAAGCVYNDVVAGNSSFLPNLATNSVPCEIGMPACSLAEWTGQTVGVLVTPTSSTTEAWMAGTGYDMATGLGSVNIGNLVRNWATVSTVPTTTTLSLSPTTGITHGTGENVSVNITVTPASGSAAGDVSLMAKLVDGTTQVVDGFTLTNGKVINGTTSGLPGGTNYSVTAHYAGDGTSAPSDSTPVSVTVGQESSQTFLVIPAFDPDTGKLVSGNTTTVSYGSPYLIEAYVTDKNGVANPAGAPVPACYSENALTCPTGTVFVTADGVPLDKGTYTLNSAGNTRDTDIPQLLTGAHTLVAQYSGDSSYQPSVSAATTLLVTRATTTLSAPSLPNPFLTAGTPWRIASTVTTNAWLGVAPAGTVTFYDGGTPIPGTVTYTPVAGGASQSPNLTAQVSVTFTTSGTHSLTAQYSGDGNFGPATSPVASVAVLYPTTMTMTADSTAINYGTSVTLTAKAISSYKNPPMTGQFIYYGSSTSLPGPVTPTLSTDRGGNQVLTAIVTVTPQASDQIMMTYLGDANFQTANTNIVSVTVNIPDFTIGPAGTSIVPMAGQLGSCQIIITPVSEAPSTVLLKLDPPVLSGYNIALSPLQVTLNGVPAMATLSLTPITGAPASAVRNQERHAGFFPIKRGNWWELGLITALGVLFLLGLPARRRKLRAVLGLTAVCLIFWTLGCGGGGSAGGGAGGGSGGPQPTSIIVTTGNGKVAQNAIYDITATVTASKPLTGTVTFYNFGAAVSGNLPVTNGQVKLNSGFVASPGLYQITATYSGDANNLPSTSAPIVQAITGTLQATIVGNTGNDFHNIQVQVGVQ